MTAQKLFLVFTCIYMLSACGGNSASKPTNASSQASSISLAVGSSPQESATSLAAGSSSQAGSTSLAADSSSQASSTSLATGSSSQASSLDTADVIFSESINANWGIFSVFEWSTLLNQGIFYVDGQTENLVQWNIVQAAAQHKNVVEVEFTAQSNRWAQFEVSPEVPLNLSAYETGKLSFDINVLEWGDLYDTVKQSGTFEVRTECGWPCTSHAYVFEIKYLNSWSHIEVSVAGMIADGLDITAIDKALIIMPDAERQQGLRFQLDNIKWVKGTTAPVYKHTVYAEHFNATVGTNEWNFVPYDGNTSTAGTYFDRGLAFYLSTTGNYYDSWALETNLDSAIDLSHKKISLQVFPDVILLDAAALRFVAIDGQGREAHTAEVRLDALTPDVWNLLSFAVDSVDFFVDTGFNVKDVRKLGIRFDANGAVYTDSDPRIKFKIDEILITE